MGDEGRCLEGVLRSLSRAVGTMDLPKAPQMDVSEVRYDSDNQCQNMNCVLQSERLGI